MNILSDYVAPGAWSMDAVAGILTDEFGLRARSLTPLGGEHDQTVVAALADGARVVAKISPAGARVDHIRWQQQLLRVLAATPVSDVVPRVIATTSGEDLTVVTGDLGPQVVRAQGWLDGIPLGQLKRHSPELLCELGTTAARMASALGQVPPPPVATHFWEVLRSPEAVAEVRQAEKDPQKQHWIDRFLSWFERAVDPVRDELPSSVVHQDFNEANVLAATGNDGRLHIAGVVDFGDALYTARVSEVAVAAAYSMLRKADPLLAAGEIVRGFHKILPLTPAELSVIYPMAATRLCVNALTWAHRQQQGETEYGSERSRYTWPAIERLARLTPDVAESWFRHVLSADRGQAGLAPPASIRIPSSSAGLALQDADLSPVTFAESEGENPQTAARAGRHLTARRNRLSRRTTGAGEPCTTHLGVDVYAASSAEILAPLAGIAEDPASDGEVSPDPSTVILRHDTEERAPFWSRWTGLQSAVPPGSAVDRGAVLGSAPPSNDLSQPSFRVVTFTSLETAQLAPTFIPAWQMPAWRAVAPDPSALLGVHRPADSATWDVQRVAAVRDTHLARSQRSYYRRPMNLVASDGVWFHDEHGHSYLDAINNVTHVGHANRRVVEAARRQMLRLNTNSRFIYDGMARYSQRLTSLLPDPLEVVFFVCTGTEANDLALRIARQVTGRRDVLVIDGAYHGSTGSTIEISPNRYKSRGGAGRPPTTHEVSQPNLYRGEFRYGDANAGPKYAENVRRTIGELVSAGRPPAAFFAESLMGTAGCIPLPDGYLNQAFAAVRAAGGLCVSDEVQVGFGRMGDSFWAFEPQSVVPDIVTMGKPIGNGYPMAAVVTTKEIAEAFDSGVKFFNTFAGNPVACAIGMAVLDEVEDRGLQAHALDVGDYFLASLRSLMTAHPLIGDVRGHGLYAGIELVRDPVSQEPAVTEAAYISERMKDEGVIVHPTGTHDNVLKLKPPMIFERSHADLFTETLEEILATPW